MSTTVLDALRNAHCNLENLNKERHPAMRELLYVLAEGQLANGIKALEAGMRPDDELQADMFSEVKVQNGSR